MRLFFGCYATPSAVQAVQQLMPWLKTLPAKLVELHNLHFTVVFLGEVSDDKLDQLLEIGESVVNKISLPQISLTKLELIPSEKNPRVLSIHTITDDNFIKLQEALIKKIKKLNISDLSAKPPHFALARLKSKISISNVSFTPQNFKLTEVSLIQSILNSTGPIYKALKTFKIGSGEVLNKYRPNVSICLLNDRNDVLLIKSGLFPGEHWQLPQGGIEPNENLEQAARRELKEECSIINVDLLGIGLKTFNYDFPRIPKSADIIGQEQHPVYLKFKGNDTEIRLNAREAIDYKWVKIDDLVNSVYPKRIEFTNIVKQELKKLIKYDQS
ncbi:MAG: RNA 2',3'-cyclic phosphodiesterase [Patescibacteria group bacterium]